MAQWRSSEMQLVQLYMQNESAHLTIDRLGDAGILEFKDVRESASRSFCLPTPCNIVHDCRAVCCVIMLGMVLQLNSEKNAFQRSFANYVKRCDDMERMLRYLHSAVLEAKLKVAVRKNTRAGEPNLTDLQLQLEKLEIEVRKLQSSQQSIQRSHDEVVELKAVLEAASLFYGQAMSGSTQVAITADDGQELARVGPGTPALDEPSSRRAVQNQLGCVTGVIPTVRLRTFERMIWRATRGNVYLKAVALPAKTVDPTTGVPVDKSAIAVFYSGERSAAKITKLCDTGGVNKYACPEDPIERARLLQDTASRLVDLNTLISSNASMRNAILSRVASTIDGWQYQVQREKAIYHCLNLTNFDRKRQCLIAECWVPVKHLDRLQRLLTEASADSGASVPSVLQMINTKEMPPTHFETNKLTAAFQAIVDSYGIARYREYNPAVFTVITFPFLFAIMFGDVGHGTIMTIVAVLVIWQERALMEAGLPDMLRTPFAGRYCILLMGIFSIYTGAIYNDCFSLPFQWGENSMWDSCDIVNNGTHPYRPEYCNPYYPMKAPVDGRIGEPYGFGIDPEWARTGNKLNFYNSFKMKLSIIFGVTQMLTGNLCKLTNALHFGKKKDFFFEFLPEITFMSALMGYLVFTIFYKWNTDWETRCVMYEPNLTAASIVTCCNRQDYPYCNGFNAVIDQTTARITYRGTNNATGHCLSASGEKIPEMNYQSLMLANGSFNADIAAGGLCYKQSPPSLLDMLINMFMSIGKVEINNQLYPGQGLVQAVLVLVAVIAIPLLLFPKPCLERCEHNAHAKASPSHKHAEAAEGEESSLVEDDDEPFEFSEHMVRPPRFLAFAASAEYPGSTLLNRLRRSTR
jgi:V-type H+-transporting ATPase subunit a